MLPSDLPIDKKGFVLSIKTISLTPPGVVTNLIFNAIIPDIIFGTLDEYDCWDIDEENVSVFTDVCGFLTICPAHSRVLNVIKQSIRLPAPTELLVIT